MAPNQAELAHSLNETNSLTENFPSLLKTFLSAQKNVEGQVVKGKVIMIDKDAAVIDVNLKSEGRVLLREFLPQEIQVGDEVEVYVERYEGPHGDVQLSHERAKQEASWHRLSESYRNRKPVEGVIINQVKGGLTVDIMGTIAFLPGSQVDTRPVSNLTSLIGTTQPFIVIKMDDSRSNVVVSRRAVLDEARAAERQHLLSTLEVGQILTGVVKNITEYGAFIDLGGIDGLLHVTDISKETVKPADVLHVGQTLKVAVIRYNKETQRISLGLRQLEKDPWININERYKVGDKVQGTVMNVPDYGAFVQIDEGLEGLIYVGEMVWNKKIIKPQEFLTKGDRVTAMILEIDTVRRRISLGLKQCTENPLEAFAAKYKPGNIVEGVIKDITEFGLLVQLPDQIDAAVHCSDLAWDDSSLEVLNRFQVGSKISMRVMNINPQKEMIGLSVKRVDPDPWKEQTQNMKKGDTVKAKVIQVLEKSIEVELMPGLRTTIQRMDLARGRDGQNPHRFVVGQEIEAKILSINPESHYLGLSIRAQELDDEREIIAGLNTTERGSSLGSLLEDAMEKKEKEEAAGK